MGTGSPDAHGHLSCAEVSRAEGQHFARAFYADRNQRNTGPYGNVSRAFLKFAQRSVDAIARPPGK